MTEVTISDEAVKFLAGLARDSARRSSNDDDIGRIKRIEAQLTALLALHKKESWTCFHCGEAFVDRHCAMLHFGSSEDSKAACMIKAGAEGSLLKALREAEDEAQNAYSKMHAESTDIARAYYGAMSRFSKSLTHAEEMGYERGVADACVERLDKTKWTVWYDPPPIPSRQSDWHWSHVDYDGAPDSGDHRCGHASSENECWREIVRFEND